MSTPNEPIGLVTGFEPFAGLPTNPAQLVLPHVEGARFGGIRVVTRTIPVSLSRAPALLASLVDEHRPAFVLALGLAAGAPSPRVETLAVNAAHFGVADNDGAMPTDAPAFVEGPLARRATWDGGLVVAAIEAEGIPARLSFHAGTHLCNAALFTLLGRLEGRRLRVPCGFLHLPYLPEQIVWMRSQDGRQGDHPSMALETQVRAVRATLAELARQAAAGRDCEEAVDGERRGGRPGP